MSFVVYNSMSEGNVGVKSQIDLEIVLTRKAYSHVTRVKAWADRAYFHPFIMLIHIYTSDTAVY